MRRLGTSVVFGSVYVDVFNRVCIQEHVNICCQCIEKSILLSAKLLFIHVCGV